MADPTVKVYEVVDIDGRLRVTGAVDGRAGDVRGWGHTEWLTGFWDKNSEIDKDSKSGERRVKREAAPDEARAYCERLLLEACGLWGHKELPVKVELDTRPG